MAGLGINCCSGEGPSAGSWVGRLKGGRKGELGLPGEQRLKGPVWPLYVGLSVTQLMEE